MLHAADVEALQELKKRIQQEATQKRELEEQLNKTSCLLQEKTATWNTLERQLKVGQLTPERRDIPGSFHTALYNCPSTTSRKWNIEFKELFFWLSSCGCVST